MGDGEKLLTHLNSALKVLLGLDIFPRVPKKKLNFVDQCNIQFTVIISLVVCGQTQEVNEIMRQTLIHGALNLERLGRQLWQYCVY